MCGIVGYVGKNNNCVRVLIEGLERLEYRGYDSAGIAYFKGNKIILNKQKGNLSNLKQKVSLDDKSNLGIGHTRWATHGRANKINAHPHMIGKFTIVHNGVIENYNELKNKLICDGYKFKSETDTEIVCALIDKLYKKENDMLKVMNELQNILKGSYALGIICKDDINNLYVIKNKSPLIIGVGNLENYIASDVPAILNYTKKYVTLDDGDYAIISYDNINIYNNNVKKKTIIKSFDFDGDLIDKNGFEHFMLKEINEQPLVFNKTIEPYLKDGINSLNEKLPDFSKYQKIRIVACGSATHAGLVGKYLLENYADIKTSVETASEFRYEKLFLDKKELIIVVSQSGETADTLEALKIAKLNKIDTLGIINAKGSSIARQADMVLYTEAGKEIAVATTKAYSCQIAIFILMTIKIAYQKKLINDLDIKNIINDAKKLPDFMKKLIKNDMEYKLLAKKLYKYNDIFFIGRGIDYAICMEGSLKLKEISYIHSEAYAAGELKHGTISLIEKNTPVVGIVTDDKIASKTISNIKEVKSRGAKVLYITNRKREENDDFYNNRIIIPKTNNLFSPLLAIIPLQLIAYYVAKLKKCSIDKPKNLAKSVTVE